MKILHAFADHGIESEVLTGFGDVIRIGLEPSNLNKSYPVKANMKKTPIKNNSFDLGLFHPECAFLSRVTNITGDQKEHENQIPLARKEAKQLCEHYIIENVPEAIDKNEFNGNTIKLSGYQFGLPIKYERAFECSFPIKDTPPQIKTTQEISPYFSSDRSKYWWKAVKGYSFGYSKTAIARNCVPAIFINYLLTQYFKDIYEIDQIPSRSSHSDERPYQVKDGSLEKYNKKEAIESIAEILNIEPQDSFTKDFLQDIAKALPKDLE